MKIINNDGSKVIKSWCDNPEQGAIDQASNLAKLPFAFKQICLMPDTHLGYGMPIGGVLATKGVVIPNAVGVDIGCGMSAIKTSLTEISCDVLKQIMGDIRKRIPVGFKRNKHWQPSSLLLPEMRYYDKKPIPIASTNIENAKESLGTLGGGNHFIEFQKGDDGFIYIMVHSGSRNLGKQVADHYNNVAVELNAKWFSSVPKEWDLAFLPLDSDEGRMYMSEMQYCVDFAFANRKLMMDKICSIVNMTVEASYEPIINIAHNYARKENHFGQNVLVHRKGATSAKLGEIGIIPGSQGTPSFIVKGLGNSESFESCSHGAGRCMGRKQACRSLDLGAEQKILDDKGIIHSVRTAKNLDESISSYKDINVVMEEQKDLVEILVKLEPLGVIKG